MILFDVVGRIRFGYLYSQLLTREKTEMTLTKTEAGIAGLVSDWGPLSVTENCILNYTGSLNLGDSGAIPIAFVIEDFDSLGSVRSSIQVQFLIILNDSTTSCEQLPQISLNSNELSQVMKNDGTFLFNITSNPFGGDFKSISYQGPIGLICQIISITNTLGLIRSNVDLSYFLIKILSLDQDLDQDLAQDLDRIPGQVVGLVMGPVLSRVMISFLLLSASGSRVLTCNCWKNMIFAFS